MQYTYVVAGFTVFPLLVTKGLESATLSIGALSFLERLTHSTRSNLRVPAVPIIGVSSSSLSNHDTHEKNCLQVACDMVSV